MADWDVVVFVDDEEVDETVRADDGFGAAEGRAKGSDVVEEDTIIAGDGVGDAPADATGTKRSGSCAATG